MDALDLARWQFAITTVYHFLFVPVTIGLSALVAWYHTSWVRTREPWRYRLTRFLGKLFIINFALGLVTGIVQEFQFGMNWSDYSRMVGDIFGAPLAFEALLAFFLESTFLGLWLFGWGKLPEKLHAATMWIVHVGTVLSAFFILAANSFMQHPVGFEYNPQTGRAELTDFVAVLTNPVQLVTFPHVLAGAYMTGGAVVMGVSLWHLRRLSSDVPAPANRTTEPASGVPALATPASTASEPGGRASEATQAPAYRRAARLGALVTLVAALGVVVSGDIQGKVMTDVQPMKMAAAEALYETQRPAEFSVFTIGSLDGSKEVFTLPIPGLLSFLGTGSFDGEVRGINDLRQEYRTQFAGNPLTVDPRTGYVPNIPTTYWTFRLMMGMGFLAMILAAMTLWVTRAKADPSALRPRWWHWAIIATPLLPLLANSFGWIFTEIGRQPWIVFGQMTTATGVSPSVAARDVLISMVVFTLLYGALAVVEVKLFLKYTRMGLEAVDDPDARPENADEDAPLVYAY